jgi:osmotically-inducible protein OsmY
MGGYQGGYGRSAEGDEGRQVDQGEEYEDGYEGGYGRQGRWGTRDERSFSGRSSFGGGSGGYGRGYEGEESGRYGESRSSDQGSLGQGSYGQRGRRGMEGAGQQRGPYSGRGPKGYQRSDERIREDVSEALSRHGHVDASEITVDVRGGEVTLTGTVDSREAKREAERAIENEPGVREVQNQLRVQERKSESQRSRASSSSPGANV